MKVGEIYTPKQWPELASPIKEIAKDWSGQIMYILENGLMATEGEMS